MLGTYEQWNKDTNGKCNVLLKVTLLKVAMRQRKLAKMHAGVIACIYVHFTENHIVVYYIW